MIIPAERLPPGIPFTLQVTAVFGVLVTVALKFCMFPNKTDPLVGVTETMMEGGGGGGGVALEPPPQPSIQRGALRGAKNAAQARIAWPRRLGLRVRVVSFGVRGRMQGGMQAKGQRKDELRSAVETEQEFSIEFSNLMKIIEIFPISRAGLLARQGPKWQVRPG